MKYKNRIVEFPKDRKELLDLRVQRELDEMKKKGEGALKSVAEDFWGIITMGNFTEEEIEKMLDEDNILDTLAVKWLDDDRVMELQEKLLEEYLQS